MKTHGNFVAVEQLIVPEIKQEKVRGLDMGVQFTRNLIQSTVVFDSDDFKSGDTVWFKADHSKSPSNQMVYEVETKAGKIRFVVMPKDYVVLVG